ncbi:hypothetical protein B4N89_46365 [Embleya scabrispora]|uniref:Schlafen AlbA-2 domain-containing protein n=1 Tax=Embleya scabrispora TaxID=159449 RepID=A0A1T3NIH0_9ACTN|nr:ATP-binding protein [Embleya scabrispora]OPC76470.1 hypothetical protein B4N89_46365 [Embleya scabrispora]
MAVVVEPVVSVEKLREVLAEGVEQPALDYKGTLDLAEKRDLVDITKDVAAMQALDEGGYLVIGADHGISTGLLTERHAATFDEAKLHPKLQMYIPEVVIQSAWHAIDGNWLVLIYVAPSPDGCCVFKSEGAYQDGKRSRTVFLPGDVFVRHGTSSERWDQGDVARIWRRAIGAHKEEWRRELSRELAAQAALGKSAASVRDRPTTALTWQLDQEVFDASILEYLRADDDIPLRRFVLTVPTQAIEVLRTTPDELPTLLGRVASLTAIGMTYKRERWALEGVDALLGVYSLGENLHTTIPNTPVSAADLWITVLDHVYALGALAVRMRNWPMLRVLADRRGTDHGFHSNGSWLRHGLTAAARAGLFHSSGLIAAARNAVRRIEALL